MVGAPLELFAYEPTARKDHFRGELAPYANLL